MSIVKRGKTPACPRAYRPTAGRRGVSGDARTRPRHDLETAETRPRGKTAELSITVHSLRVTALTSARERRSDVIDLVDFAGHADPRTTLTQEAKTTRYLPLSSNRRIAACIDESRLGKWGDFE